MRFKFPFDCGFAVVTHSVKVTCLAAMTMSLRVEIPSPSADMWVTWRVRSWRRGC
jgi:hypothetical protein